MTLPAYMLADDPIVFARACGISPDPWQARALSSRSKRLLLNCARQSGKSTVAAIAAGHRAIFKPKSVQLLISPSLRQSSELFGKVLDVMRACPIAPRRAEESKLSLRLANGSRIISLPSSEDTIRGYSAVDRVIEDEAAFVDEALYIAVRPMLAVSGGELWLMSTPNGRRGHFFDAWETGGEVWERHTVTAHHVPRIAASFLEEEKRALGARFAQEYECAFIDAAGGRVYHAYDPALNLIEKAPKCQYHVLGIDYGVVDACAFTVLGWRDHDPCVYVPQSYRKQAYPTTAAEEAKALEAQYDLTKIVGDLGGMGKGFAEEAARRFALPIEAAAKVNKNGYIALLNGDLARGRVKVVRSGCADLVDEWLTLPWAENRTKEAPGFANHAADSCLYAWRAASAFAESPPPQPPTDDERIKAEEQRMWDAEKEAHEKPWWEAA